MNVGGFAGFIHNFTNAAFDTWTPQDWSAYEGFAFWLYGQNTGTDLFIDLIENRNRPQNMAAWSISLLITVFYLGVWRAWRATGFELMLIKPSQRDGTT